MSNVKNYIIGIAIFILTTYSWIYGLSLLYGTAPEYEKYCPVINDEKECKNFGGNWINYTEDENYPKIPSPRGQGYCEVFEVCEKRLRDAQENYSKKIFLTSLPIGIVMIIIGALFFQLVVVGAGLMAGGIGIIIYGIFGFWRFADDWIKFILSLTGLIIVIWLAYFFNKKFNKKRGK